MDVNCEKVRVLIVGDSGVGKTCLTHLIAHNESLADPGWTVGCNIEVKLHNFKENMQQQTLYAIELFDIGGSLSHKNTRGVFYSCIHGIILVHDLTNSKSHENLREWLLGIMNKEGKDTLKNMRAFTPTRTIVGSPGEHGGFDPEEFLGYLQIPVLVIGTKLDLVDDIRQNNAIPKAGGIAEQCGAEEIWLNCRDSHSLSAGSTDAVKITRFFDRVIEKQIQARGSTLYGSGGANMAERRRYTAAPSSSSSFN